MTTQNLTLLKAMTHKMGWLEENQKVLAQNIANADTPGASAYELTKPDFKAMLGRTTSAMSLGAATVARTNDKHIGLDGASASSGNVREKKDKKPYEVAPAGNAIVLEEQLIKMNENVTDHRLITNLYQKNIDLLKLSTRSGN